VSKRAGDRHRIEPGEVSKKKNRAGFPDISNRGETAKDGWHQSVENHDLQCFLQTEQNLA
jgi:hypothetical protein